MHKPESVQENEIYTILWDFEIETDQLARRPDQMISNKKIESVAQWILPFEQITEEKKRNDRQVLRPCQGTKKQKQWNMSMTLPIVVGAYGTAPNALDRELE